MMNGADKIKERILADAQALHDKILEDARKEADEIVKQAELEAKQKLTSNTERAGQEALEFKKRLLAVSTLEDKKRTLKVRQDLINGAFDTALTKLSNLPQEQYAAFLENLLLEVARAGQAELLLNVRDRQSLGESFMNSVNAKLKEKLPDASVVLSNESISASGGFVLKYGEMEINCTLEILLVMRRSELETEVAGILFKE